MRHGYFEADLLIIGGGTAGCFAAHRAHELNPEARIVILEKGHIKYGGSIARGMDALGVVMIPQITTMEEYVERVKNYCGGIADSPLIYTMGRRSFEVMKKIEAWGVHFPRDENGHYRAMRTMVSPIRAIMDSTDLKVILWKKVVESGARVINRVMGIRILMDGGRVAGAVGLNVRTGQLVICRAKAVILAAGGNGRFTLPHSGYLYGTFEFPGNTGDAYTMAFDAGARLTGMEYTFQALQVKEITIPLIANTAIFGAQALDAMDRVLVDGAAATSLEPLSRAHAEGRGPVRVRLSHLPEETIREIEHILFTVERPAMERFLKGRKIDFRKDDVELWPTETFLCGGHGLSGIVVNTKAETGIPGVYAAGDAAGVARGHLTGAFTFAEIAAEEALQFIAPLSSPGLDPKQVSEAEDLRNRRFTSTGRQVGIRELEYKVRRMIGDYLISPKSEYKMTRWFYWAERFQRELDQEVKICNGHELAKLYEVENIVRCASLSAKASLERKESRWGETHRRVDYPERDDRNWFCHIDLRRGDFPGEIIPGKRPIVTEWIKGE